MCVACSRNFEGLSMTDERPTKEEGIYEYIHVGSIRAQLCPLCKSVMSDMPGSRDAVCHNCGYKDPCCE
jgi:hypothetical protein